MRHACVGGRSRRRSCTTAGPRRSRSAPRCERARGCGDRARTARHSRARQQAATRCNRRRAAPDAGEWSCSPPRPCLYWRASAVARHRPARVIPSPSGDGRRAVLVPDPPKRCSAELPLRYEGCRAARDADRLGDVVGRDEDHGRCGMRGAQATSRLEPVHPRHSRVDEDQLGRELRDELRARPRRTPPRRGARSPGSPRSRLGCCDGTPRGRRRSRPRWMSASSPALRPFDPTMAAAAAGRNVADWCPGKQARTHGGGRCARCVAFRRLS